MLCFSIILINLFLFSFNVSFPDCYAAEFGELEILLENRRGVPLEHLITCVPGVNIATAQNGVKVVKWIHNKPPPPNTGRGQVFGPSEPPCSERRLLTFILNVKDHVYLL